MFDLGRTNTWNRKVEKKWSRGRNPLRGILMTVVWVSLTSHTANSLKVPLFIFSKFVCYSKQPWEIRTTSVSDSTDPVYCPFTTPISQIRAAASHLLILVRKPQYIPMHLLNLFLSLIENSWELLLQSAAASQLSHLDQRLHPRNRRVVWISRDQWNISDISRHQGMLEATYTMAYWPSRFAFIQNLKHDLQSWLEARKACRICKFVRFPILQNTSYRFVRPVLTEPLCNHSTPESP